MSDGVPDPFFALFLSLAWFGEWIDIYPRVPVGASEVGIALCIAVMLPRHSINTTVNSLFANINNADIRDFAALSYGSCLAHYNTVAVSIVAIIRCRTPLPSISPRHSDVVRSCS